MKDMIGSRSMSQEEMGQCWKESGRDNGTEEVSDMYKVEDMAPKRSRVTEAEDLFVGVEAGMYKHIRKWQEKHCLLQEFSAWFRE